MKSNKTFLFFFIATIFISTVLEARPIRFAECNGGVMFVWTLGSDGAYHSDKGTRNGCEFKSIPVIINKLDNNSAKMSAPKGKSIKLADLNSYLNENKETIIFITKEGKVINKREWLALDEQAE